MASTPTPAQSRKVAQADQIEFIMAGLTDFVREEVIGLAMEITAELKENPPEGTPIATGWASANWVPSMGEPFEDPDIALVKEPTLAQVTARAAQAATAGVQLHTWQFGQGLLYVTNNVPYILPLNDGHSPKSPPGFVQTGIARAIDKFEAKRAAAGRT